MNLPEVRRHNLQRIAEELGGQARLAEKSKKSGPYVSQVLNGVKSLGEAATRQFERSLGMPLGALDEVSRSEGPASLDLSLLSGTERLLVQQVAAALVQNGRRLTETELRLVAAYRKSSKQSKAVILAVAEAQASSTLANNTPSAA